jgi:hypothetical protein
LGGFGDPFLEPAPNTESVLVEVKDQEATAYNEDLDNCDYDDDDTIENEEDDEGMKELEPLFRRGCRLRSNLLDMDDEEPIFVMELTSQEKARAREFPNGNGECDKANF